MSDFPPGWLPLEEYRAIYRRVPRVCVEVVIVSADQGVMLTLRDVPPNIGAWHIPGGTVLFAERVVDAVRRVAMTELGVSVSVGELLGYIEYPSHYLEEIDSPVGLAFRCAVASPGWEPPQGAGWFTTLPDGLYAEQRAFLSERLGFA